MSKFLGIEDPKLKTLGFKSVSESHKSLKLMPVRYSVGKFSPSSTSSVRRYYLLVAMEPFNLNIELRPEWSSKWLPISAWRHKSIRIDDVSAWVSSLVQVGVLEIKRINVIVLLYKQLYVSVILSAVLGLTWTVEAWSQAEALAEANG